MKKTSPPSPLREAGRKLKRIGGKLAAELDRLADALLRAPRPVPVPVRPNRRSRMGGY